MPAADGAHRAPRALLVAAAALIVARVVLAIVSPEPAGERPVGAAARGGGGSAVRWREPGAGEAEAAAAGRPVLYDFTAEWCSPCRAMEREVFTDAGFARELERVAVPVRVLDRQHEEGRNPERVAALQTQFRVDAFPTLIVYEPRTGKFERLEGYPGAARTRAWMLERPAAVAASPAPAPLPPGGP